MPLPFAVTLLTLPIPAVFENQVSLKLLAQKIARLSSYFPFLNKDSMREFSLNDISQSLDENVKTINEAYRNCISILDKRLKAKQVQDFIESDGDAEKKVLVENCQELFEKVVFYYSYFTKKSELIASFNVNKFTVIVDNLYQMLGYLSTKVTGFLFPSTFFSIGHYLTIVKPRYNNDSFSYAFSAFFSWQSTYKTELDFIHLISVNPHCSEEVRLALVSTLTPSLKASPATYGIAELLSKVSMWSAAPFMVDYSKEEIVLHKDNLQIPELFLTIFNYDPHHQGFEEHKSML